MLASPALAFEGEVRATLSSQGGVAARVRAVYAQNGDVRMDIRSSDADGQPVVSTMIMPAEGNLYYTLAPTQKLVIEMPYETLAATSQQVKGSGDDANLEVTKLGSETVSGIETRHVRIVDRDNDAVIDLWLTEKYPSDLWTRAFRGRNLGLEISDDERAKAMKRYGIEPGFSMKMRVEHTGGVPVVFLVERVRRGTVPAAEFTVPAGYKRVRGPLGSQP